MDPKYPKGDRRPQEDYLLARSVLWRHCRVCGRVAATAWDLILKTLPLFVIVFMALMFWWSWGWQIIYGEPIIIEESRAIVDRASPGQSLVIYVRYRIETNCPDGSVQWRLISRNNEVINLPTFKEVPTELGRNYLVKVDASAPTGPATLQFLGMWRCTPLADFIYRMEFPTLIALE